MLESLLAKIGLPILIGVVAQALGRIDTPVTKAAAEALNQVDEALQKGQISDAQMIEANRHIEEVAKLQSEDNRAALSEINQSLRAEILSEDKYVRRMRPTFGYFMAVSWMAQMLGLAYVIVFETEKAGIVLTAMGSLSAIWAVGLSVLGIYVYKRSEDKKHAISPLKTTEKIMWNTARHSKVN